MPPLYYLIVAGLTILYVILVQIVKKIYIKKLEIGYRKIITKKDNKIHYKKIVLHYKKM